MTLLRHAAVFEAFGPGAYGFDVLVTSIPSSRGFRAYASFFTGPDPAALKCACMGYYADCLAVAGMWMLADRSAEKGLGWYAVPVLFIPARLAGPGRLLPVLYRKEGILPFEGGGKPLFVLDFEELRGFRCLTHQHIRENFLIKVDVSIIPASS
ncbi:MAG: hypothetical protein HFG01_05710 [Oscillibacter sp.]|nr:hypothetical protein [Oscillibacter sp.]